jgi:hypothetical protein
MVLDRHSCGLRSAARLGGPWYRQEGSQAQTICRLDHGSHVVVRRLPSWSASRTRGTLLHWNYTRSTESSPIKTWRGRATFTSVTRAARTICTRRNGSRP